MPSLIPRWVLFPGFVPPAPWASQGLDRPPRPGGALGKVLALRWPPAPLCRPSRRERRVPNPLRSPGRVQERVTPSCAGNKRHPVYWSSSFDASCWGLSGFPSSPPEPPGWGNTQELFLYLQKTQLRVQRLPPLFLRPQGGACCPPVPGFPPKMPTGKPSPQFLHNW